MSAELKDRIRALETALQDLKTFVEDMNRPLEPAPILSDREWPVDMARTRTAITIIEALDTPVDSEMLAKQIAADGEVPVATVLKWLRSALVRGVADPSHPLFPYLVEKKPLRFGRKE